MIKIVTEGPVGEKFASWRQKAQVARDEFIRKRHESGQTPNADAEVLRELKVTFLFKVFGEKCAYCESVIEKANLPGAVDHYRPTRAVTVNRKQVEHPGYYWLVYEWDNLLLVCHNCNSPHSEYVNGEQISHLGKLNEFPIKGARMMTPSDDPATWAECLKSELPLLLNPYQDEPEDHIAFSDLGVPYPKQDSERGDATIKVCHLDRFELCEKRREVASDLFRKRMHSMLERPGTKALAPNDPFLAWLKRAIPMHVSKLLGDGGIRVETVSIANG